MSFFFKSTPSVPVTEAVQKVRASDAAFIDVRSPAEFASGHATGAQNCPLPRLGDCIDKLASFKEVYVICQSGGRSSSAVSHLRSAKINAINITGGTLAWRMAGLPIT